MALNGIEPILQATLAELAAQGMCKGEEQVICGIMPAGNGFGPRYLLAGQGEKEFLRMNSNSYLGLGLHSQVIAAEEEAVRIFGAGPGAVRFISGTHASHVELEKRLSSFHGRQAAMLFSAAYATVVGILPQLIDGETAVVSDSLNHNCIINGIRLARPVAKAVYLHNDMADLEARLRELSGQAKRLLVVTDGIFSMRGDHAPLDRLVALCQRYEDRFPQGIITVVDDSHGVGVFGPTGRGVEEETGVRADILIGTLGKAFGVNGGYVATSATMIRYLRETAPFYIYSNPITPAEAAAAQVAVDIVDSGEGLMLLAHLRGMGKRFEDGLADLGFEFLPGPHPIVPLLVRDTARTAQLVDFLFKHQILATGIKFPVVPHGDEEIRFQINAGHTEADIDAVLAVLRRFSDEKGAG